MCTSVCWKDCSAVASAAAAVVSVAVCRLETKGKVGTFLAARKDGKRRTTKRRKGGTDGYEFEFLSSAPYLSSYADAQLDAATTPERGSGAASSVRMATCSCRRYNELLNARKSQLRECDLAAQPHLLREWTDLIREMDIVLRHGFTSQLASGSGGSGSGTPKRPRSSSFNQAPRKPQQQGPPQQQQNKGSSTPKPAKRGRSQSFSEFFFGTGLPKVATPHSVRKAKWDAIKAEGPASHQGTGGPQQQQQSSVETRRAEMQQRAAQVAAQQFQMQDVEDARLQALARQAAIDYLNSETPNASDGLAAPGYRPETDLQYQQQQQQQQHYQQHLQRQQDLRTPQPTTQATAGGAAISPEDMALQSNNSSSLLKKMALGGASSPAETSRTDWSGLAAPMGMHQAQQRLPSPGQGGTSSKPFTSVSPAPEEMVLQAGLAYVNGGSGSSSVGSSVGGTAAAGPTATMLVSQRGITNASALELFNASASPERVGGRDGRDGRDDHGRGIRGGLDDFEIEPEDLVSAIELSAESTAKFGAEAAAAAAAAAEEEAEAAAAASTTSASSVDFGSAADLSFEHLLATLPVEDAAEAKAALDALTAGTPSHSHRRARGALTSPPAPSLTTPTPTHAPTAAAAAAPSRLPTLTKASQRVGEQAPPQQQQQQQQQQQLSLPAGWIQPTASGGNGAGAGAGAALHSAPASTSPAVLTVGKASTLPASFSAAVESKRAAVAVVADAASQLAALGNAAAPVPFPAAPRVRAVEEAKVAAPAPTTASGRPDSIVDLQIEEEALARRRERANRRLRRAVAGRLRAAAASGSSTASSAASAASVPDSRAAANLSASKMSGAAATEEVGGVSLAAIGVR
eukprot:gene5144-23666_t